MIESVVSFLKDLPETNPFGEKITLVAATKTQTAETVNEAIRSGITHIGENRVQEFIKKYPLIEGNPVRHFIGRLQTNKVKYLLGKTNLFQSVDRMNLAEEISAQSLKRGIVSEILIEINIGNEQSKGGFSYGDAQNAYTLIKSLPAIKIRGIMTLLPNSEDIKLLRRLAKNMRKIYDILRENDGNINTLSMGMSGDYRLCIEEGSNMIRIGTSLFGKRSA